MKLVEKCGIMFCLGGALSYGAMWSGKLMDATCYDAQKSSHHQDLTKVCAPTASTTDFAIRTTDGKVYRFDSTGNSTLADDIKSGVLKKDHDGDIHASVTGSRDKDIVTVNSVNLEAPRKQ